MVSMYPRTLRLTVLMLALFAFIGTSSTDVPKAPFSLAVVPTKSLGEGGSITMAHNKPRDFYVVLSNVSNQPEAVWEYWNSWGYQTISFEFVTANGQKIVVSKRKQEFTRNGPSTFLIQPGEHQVYAIRLDSDWEPSPALSKADEMPIKLKVVYEVRPSPEATQYNVWIGQLESRSYNFTLRQW